MGREPARLVLGAAVLLASLGAAAEPDAGSRPCDDFYQYACDPWLASHPLPADQSAWDPYYELAQKNADDLRAIVEGTERASGREAQAITDFYASCMNLGAIEDGGVAPLAAELEQIDRIHSPPQAAAALAMTQRLGADALFTLDASNHPEHPDLAVARIDLPELGMTDAHYYLADDPQSLRLREAYRVHLQHMLAYGGWSADAASDGAEGVIQLETTLARTTPTHEQQRDPHARHHVLTREQLLALIPAFPWAAYFQGIGLPPPAEVDVGFPDHLAAALKAWLALPPDAQRAYLRWLLLSEVSAMLPACFGASDFEFYGQALDGAQKPTPRPRRCARLTTKFLGEAVGQMYVAHHFSAERKARVLALIRAIQSALRDDLQTLTWMSAPTRREALAKLDGFLIKVGYPDHWRDYSGLEVRRNDAAGNYLRARRFEHDWRMAKIGKPLDRGEWSYPPHQVEGYESDDPVQVVFTAGILQPPFFDDAGDDASNLGAIGRVIGHEFTHGFDDNGRHYDHAGRLRDWWTPADAASFEQRAKCFVDQYSGFVVIDGQHLNGRLTLGENLADNGGIRLAYAALRARSLDTERNIGSEPTPEQRFFLAFARTQCANVSPETIRGRLLREEHAPGRFRVNGTLSNMPEFQQAFACKATDAMVSAHRCRLW